MKRIKLKSYEKALITKNGKLVDVLLQGNHWIAFGKEAIKMDITKPFILTKHLELSLDPEILDKYATIIDIGDNEIGLEMKDEKFSKVLENGKYVYWKEGLNYDVIVIEKDKKELSSVISKTILTKQVLRPYLNIYKVESYQTALLYFDGKYEKSLEPGIYYYWNAETEITIKKVDLRAQLMEISGQEILTKDKAGIRLNFVIQYQVDDVLKAIQDNQDYAKQLYTSIQLVLREYIGTKTLDQLLSNKESISSYLSIQAEKIAKELGITLLSGGIKDVILPGDVKDIMNQVLIAQKKAQANSIMRHEETASTRSLLNTAKLMEQNKMLLKLKEMEYMEKIADKIGEISINGKGRVVDQLADLLVTTSS